MKITKKFLPFILSVMLLIAALPGQVFAATNGQNAQGYAGETVVATVPFNGVYGVQGEISIQNGDFLENVSIAVSASASGSKAVNGMKFSYAPDGEDAVSGSIQVTAKIKSTATAGQKASISVKNGISTTVDFQDKNWASSASITVIEKPGSGDDDSGDTPGTPGTPGTPDTPNKPSDNKPSSPTTSPTDEDAVDYSALKEQIKIAEGIAKDGYTKASWDALMTALADANNALSSKNQDSVDAATQALKAAIAGLVKMDYSKLQAAIDAGNSLIASDDLGTLWQKLVEAITNYTALLTSDDQEAVDAATAELLAIIDEITAALGGAVDDGAAEPDGDYCNVPIHKVWPILFFISLIVNVVLIVFLFLKKKDKKGDDTPMVDYRIGDDD